MKRPVRYSPPASGFAAIHPRAWGAEFQIEIAANAEPPPVKVQGDYAVVSICGPLYQHACFPFDDYDSILCRVQAAFESEAKCVALYLDSPGGDFAGSIELARAIRQVADAKGKPLIAWTDSKCLSAAYAIACAADQICAAPSAFVANVGVWAPLFDVTGQDKMMGHRYVFASTGARKLDHNPHVPVSESAYEALQSQVDEMGEMFFAHVAERRGISVEAIKAVQGAELLATRALGAKLVDDLSDSFADLTKTSGPGKLEGSATSLGKAMAKKSLSEAMKAALAEVRGAYDESEGEEREKAKKAMRKMEALFEDGDGDKDGEKKEEASASAKGESEDSDKKKEEAEARAKAEAEDKEKKEAEAKAMASSSLAMAQQLQALQAKVLASENAERRAKAFASRPDLAPEVRAFLEKQPIETIEDACKTFPRAQTTAASSASSLTPGATQGGDLSVAPSPDAKFIDKHMHGTAPTTGIKVAAQGRSLELGYLSPKEASELAKKYQVQ